MPLPAGFKVNGSKIKHDCTIPVPPRVQKITTLLEKLPTTEVLTTSELLLRLGVATGGYALQHPSLTEYREKVDNKLFWGSRKSIVQLRKQLSEPEEANDQN
jgi:hypothetical protein